jgi:hypothetical protein
MKGVLVSIGEGNGKEGSKALYSLAQESIFTMR